MPPLTDKLPRKISVGPCVLLLVAITITTGFGQAVASTSRDIRDAMSRFLTAFNNLDWPAFKDCFSPSATMFFPVQIPRRVEQESFHKTWLSIFEYLRKQAAGQGKTSPPYLDIKPNDVRIDQLKPDIAVVTFHLGSDPNLNRRTLVLQKLPTGWKIVHLHGSSVTKQ